MQPKLTNHGVRSFHVTHESVVVALLLVFTFLRVQTSDSGTLYVSTEPPQVSNVEAQISRRNSNNKYLLKMSKSSKGLLTSINPK